MCRGTRTTTASLTSLLQDESEEVAKSIHSCTAGLFFLAGAEKDEASQQLSQDGDVDVSAAGRAVLLPSKGPPALGEGGRTSEGLRSSSLGQRHEPRSCARGWIPGESELCRALLAPAPKAARARHHPRTGRTARPGLPPYCWGCPALCRTGGKAGSCLRGDCREKPVGKGGTKSPALEQSLAECPNLCPSMPHRQPRAAGCSSAQGRGDGLAAEGLAPYLQ